MSTPITQMLEKIETASQKYKNPECSTNDLLYCESIFLEALDLYTRTYGAESEKVGYIHSWLSVIYLRMNDRFDQGEASCAEACKIYKDPANQATVTHTHALILGKKGRRLISAITNQRSLPANQQQDLQLGSQALEKAFELHGKAYELAIKALAAAREQAAKKPEESKPVIQAPQITFRSPRAILADLNTVVIGQQSAKRGLANAASQHLRRLLLSPDQRAKTDKSNVLVVGPTGCGKTLLAQALASAISVPFHHTVATKLTASGYVGEDVQSILVGLLRAADFDVVRAQQGIIYLDEIDKLASHDTGGQIDVRGKAVQEELLTVIEGTRISVPKDGNKKNSGETVEIDTTNILFVLGGAFAGLGEVVASRMASTGGRIGFGAKPRSKDEDTSGYVKFATAEDLIAFGMMPEFIGRLPKRLALETLSVEELVRILLEPKKALIPQKRLLLSATTDLRFTEGAVLAIAEEARKTGTNGRALLEIVEQVLDPIVFMEPAVAIVTKEMVLNRSAEIQAANMEITDEIPVGSLDFIVADDRVEITLKEATVQALDRRRDEGNRADPADKALLGS